MTAPLLRFHLITELTIYWLILYFWAGSEWHPAQIFLTMLGLCLALRGLIVATSYGFFAVWGIKPTPELRSGWSATAYAFIQEWTALVLLSMVIMPFEQWWMGGSDRLKKAIDGRPPILLIHGFFASRGFWYWIKKKLEARGWVVATITLRPVLGDIDGYVSMVGDRVESVLTEAAAKQVILVGHSMGGLVARAYLRNRGTQRVARLVTLASPHHGTRLAVLGLGENARQMRIGSDWLKALNSPGAVPLPPSVAIYSYGDNVVVPQLSAKLDGIAEGQSIAVATIGHVAMALSPAFIKVVIDVLERKP